MRTDRELHHFVTDEHRFRILHVILEHTHQLPTRYEISQFCPALSDDELDEYLAELLEADVVESVVIPEAERDQNQPYRFFGISNHGWRFMLNHNLVDAEGVVHQWQDADVEDPRKLARHESAPRPETGQAFRGRPASKTPEQQLEEYKLVVEQAKDALYMLDADGRYVLVNEAYEKLTGYPRDKLLGSSTSIVLDPDAMAERHERISEMLSEDSSQRSHTWQSTLNTASGEALPVEVNFAALEFNGEFIGIVGSARDITHRRRRQQERAVLSRVLRHNLSNKLNVIQGYAEVIEDIVDDDGVEPYAGKIQRTSHKLIQQSEKARDIHDLLQEWPPERRPIDVTNVLWEVATELESDQLSASISTDMPDSAWIRVPDEFEMAIEELLQNAIEHADNDHPHVEIRVSVSGDDGEVVIDVADDGPGIPDHEVKVISTNEETPLSHSEGLGLWLVNWIVTAADGELTFERSNLGGSCVRLRFAEAEPPALTLSM
ncbi:PAS domain S-box protein [Halobacteriales archaeon Cl-PHB]